MIDSQNVQSFKVIIQEIVLSFNLNTCYATISPIIFSNIKVIIDHENHFLPLNIKGIT